MDDAGISRAGKPGIKVNAACPGFISTDINNFQGTRTAQQGAGEAVRLERRIGSGEPFNQNCAGL